MGVTFKCPFCGADLITMNNLGTGGCLRCGFVFDAVAKSGSITDRAPDYLLESMLFLNTFYEADSRFVLSPVELFRPGFKASECMFFGNKSKIEVGLDMDKKNKSRVKDVSKMHIIAGKRMLSDTMLPYFQNALHHSAENNPLVTTEPITAERHLYLLTLLATVTTEYKPNVLHVCNTYFSTSLEETIQRCWHKFYGVIGDAVTKERAMYAFVMCEPEVNISWGKGALGLEDSIKKYALACMNGIENIDIANIPANRRNDLNLRLLSDKVVEEVKMSYLKGMPSTAINAVSGNYAFDILNHCIEDNPFEGCKADINGTIYLEVNATYNLLYRLWDKYATVSKQLGIDAKEKYMYEETGSQDFKLLDNDEFLVRFWQTMYDDLRGTR